MSVGLSFGGINLVSKRAQMFQSTVCSVGCPLKRNTAIIDRNTVNSDSVSFLCGFIYDMNLLILGRENILLFPAVIDIIILNQYL